MKINDVLNDKDSLKISGENFLKVSAKTGENINEAFEYLLDIIKQNNDKGEQIIRPTQKFKKKKQKMKCC